MCSNNDVSLQLEETPSLPRCWYCILSCWVIPGEASVRQMSFLFSERECIVIMLHSELSKGRGTLIVNAFLKPPSRGCAVQSIHASPNPFIVNGTTNVEYGSHSVSNYNYILQPVSQFFFVLHIFNGMCKYFSRKTGQNIFLFWKRKGVGFCGLM